MSDECLITLETAIPFYVVYQAVMRKFTLADEAASVINVHLQREGRLLIGKVAEIGTVELLGKATSRNLRYHQCLRLLGEGLKEADYFTEGGLVGDGAVAISTFIEH